MEVPNLLTFYSFATMRHVLLFFPIVLNSCGSDDNDRACSSANINISLLNATSPTQCDKQNGSITLLATGGMQPYQYKLNTGSTIISQTNPNFENLFAGKLEVEVIDKLNCRQSFEFALGLATPSGISYSTQVKPILDARCNLSSCHDGSLGASRDWRSLDVIKTKLNNFQRVVSQGRMPPPPNEFLSDAQVSQILCWIADGAPGN